MRERRGVAISGGCWAPPEKLSGSCMGRMCSWNTDHPHSHTHTPLHKGYHDFISPDPGLPWEGPKLLLFLL